MTDLTEKSFRSVCRACGQEQVLLLRTIPGPPPPDPKDSEPVVIEIRWHGGRASHEELLAMRRFIAEFRDRPMSELYAAVHDAPSWPLGVHPRSYAHHIQDEARRFGLTVEIHETVA